MRTRFFLSLLALFFAGGILVVSLWSATQVSSTGSDISAERKLYFNRAILPDHLLYPALMAVDRIQLETASDNERIFINVEYAHRRLGYAEELLDMEKEGLALTTLTKAEQYLRHAIIEANELKAPDSVKQRIAKAVEYHIKRLKELSPQFDDANRAIIDRITSENEVLLQSLQ